MFPFLSRHPRNAKRLSQMQLESDCNKLAKKVKTSMIQESTKVKPSQKNKQPVLQFPPDCAKQPKCVTIALEVDGIVREFVNTNIYIDAVTSVPVPNDAEQKEFCIPAEVKRTMAHIIGVVDLKFGGKKTGNLEFMGRIIQPQL